MDSIDKKVAEFERQMFEAKSNRLDAAAKPPEARAKCKHEHIRQEMGGHGQVTEICTDCGQWW